MFILAFTESFGMFFWPSIIIFPEVFWNFTWNFTKNNPSVAIFQEILGNVLDRLLSNISLLLCRTLSVVPSDRP